MSSPTRWIRVRELFDLALEQPTEAREAWVREATGTEVALGDEVLSLLAALDHARGTLERPAVGVVLDSLADADESLLVGKRVGAYDIVRLVGYGGMGAVYEAVRADGDFAKRVAIKFLRPGMGSDLAIRRFRYERQILASLNHKNIAGLHDGGVTPEGQPYFVMEYVEGTPITTYCSSSVLAVRDRVSLFRQVCAAVQHAHQQLIVHRDLKPGNILVTPDGTVKLLDFGIAKLLREEEGPDQLPMTRGGVRVFTPEYASPEQVRGLPLAAASDIYSLGVILFELLAGRRPFSTDGKLMAEIEHDICTVPPARPSAMLSVEAAPGFAEGHAPGVRRRVAGDLDAIVLTALAKEPVLRYGTAEQFASDLKRWLDGHPVSARKAWLGYRARRFIGRHRFEVTAASIAVAALVGGIVSTSRQARIARTEAAKAAQVNSFISTMLSAVDPGYQGRDVTVAQVLSQAARDVGKQALDPEVEAEIRHTIGQTYYGLGLYDSATVHARRAVVLRQRTYGDDDQRTAASYSYLVALAEARGAYAEAESLARVNVDMQRRMTTPRPSELAIALDNLARMIEHQGHLAEAHEVKLESIGIRRRATDSASRAGLPFSLNAVAVSNLYQGKYAAAESLMREALVVEGEVRGKNGPNYGDLLRGFAGALDEMGKRQEADTAIRESVRILRASLGPDHATYLRALTMFATLRYTAGDMRAAVAAASEVAGKVGGALPEGDQTSSSVLQVLGLALDSLGRHAEAEAPLRRSLDLRRKYLPPDHWAIASSESVVGYHLSLVKRYDEAERILILAYDKLEKARGRDADVTKRVAFRIAEMYGKMGRAADAAKWKVLAA
ncbi:MAG: protein kinase domain-containing protein [Gemmatimonadaceae bacterium]